MTPTTTGTKCNPLILLSGATLGLIWLASRSSVQAFTLSTFIDPGSVADLAATLPPDEDAFILAAWELAGGDISYSGFGSDLKFSAYLVYCKRCFLASQVLKSGVSNCVGKSILLVSLLRNRLPPERVYLTVGQLNTDHIGGHAWCCPAGTKINCFGELKNIEDIKVGDRVMTGSANTGVVKAISQRPYTGPLYSIKRAYHSEFLKVTADHPILVYNRKRVKGARQATISFRTWKKAKDLKVGDYVAEPVIRETIDVEKWEKTMHYKRPKHLHLSLSVNKDTMRLVGYYLAEGTLQDVKRTGLGRVTPGARVIFYFNSKEREYLDDVAHIIGEEFNGATWETPYHNCSTMRIETKNRTLFEFLSEFGRGAKNKRLPTWVMKLPREKQAELLKGYFRGDGYHSGQVFKVSSASRDLIEDIRFLLLRLNVVASLKKYTAAEQQKNECKGKPSDHWVLAISGRYAKRLGTLLDVDVPSTRRRHQYLSFFTGNGTRGYKRACYRVKEIKRQEVVGLPVFNLQVSSNRREHNYLAEGFLVHNCIVQRKDQQWYLLEATMPPPINPWRTVSSLESIYTPEALVNDQGLICMDEELCITVKKASCPCQLEQAGVYNSY